MERFAKAPSAAAAVILRTLNQSVTAIKETPLRKVVQWEWDAAKNTLTEKRELSRKGASGIVFAARKGKD